MNKVYALKFIVLMLYVSTSFAQQATRIDTLALSRIIGIADGSSWGTFSNRYAGISHVPQVSSGLRFDMAILPGYFKGRSFVPNVTYQSDYYLWKSNKSITRFTFRYELEWKDQVYIDADYQIQDSSHVLITMRCVNKTALPHDLAINLMGYVAYPDPFPSLKYKADPLVSWKNAVDYKQIFFHETSPRDSLVYDRLRRGEVRGADFIDGSALSSGFGEHVGDRVVYAFDKLNARGTLAFRYRVKAGAENSFKTSGLVDTRLVFKGTGRWEWMRIPYTANQKSIEHTLTLESTGSERVELNGILSGDSSLFKQSIQPTSKKYVPELTVAKGGRTVVLKYADLPGYYGIGWRDTSFRVRQFLNDELDILFKKSSHNHVSDYFLGYNEGHYTNVFIRPVEVAAHSERTVHALVCTGNLAEVDAQLSQFELSNDYKVVPSRPFSRSAVPTEHSRNTENRSLKEGEKYALSIEMLKANTLLNEVYPIYTQRRYIKHFSPGKWWNSLYTWDAGFVSIGLNAIDPPKGLSNVNTYVTAPGNQSYFIHHGTMLPIPAFAFFDAWNYQQDASSLKYFYPRLKRNYDYFAGHAGGGSTRTFKSNLLKTWDYFYNTGWDDYPPQMGVRNAKLEKLVSPVITTAHVLRLAKLMRMAAMALGRSADIQTYDADIAAFSTGLQKYSWDEKVGYYGYVLHDKNGNPESIYKDPVSGINFNKGQDGAYPLMSGICTPAQEKILVDKLFSFKNLWTQYGITSVDQSAPYYRIDGYWNGTIWFPHQWFMWKTMLDLGEGARAFKIASTGLNLWKRETDDSYNASEFFSRNGSGSGWHQFTSLTSPALSWYTAYYKIGTATPGFEIWKKTELFGKDYSLYTAELDFDKTSRPHARTYLVCMRPGNYRATFNGAVVPVLQRFPGLAEITLPKSNDNGRLVVSAQASAQTGEGKRR